MKSISISVMAFFILLLSGSVLATEIKTSTSALMCPSDTVQLFSCQLRSRNIVYLCLNNNNLSLNFRIINSQKKFSYIRLKNPKQIIGNSESGASVILKGDSILGLIGIYYDSPSPDSGETVFQITRNQQVENDFCEDSTIKIPLSKWTGPKHAWNSGIDLFNLLYNGVTKPLATNVESEAEAWKSWPKPK